LPTDISFLKEKRRSLVGLSCERKKQFHAEYMRNWRKKHPKYTEKQKVAFQNFLEKNPDYQYEYNRTWRKNHPDKILQARCYKCFFGHWYDNSVNYSQ
jgi:uncharacterized short protein YbdD (DUF466 family)